MSPALLARYREAVLDAKRGTALQKLSAALRDASYTVGGESYKRVPKGAPADHPRAALLKHGGLFGVWEDKHPKELHADGFLAFAEGHYRAFAPLHRWFSRWLKPSIAAVLVIFCAFLIIVLPGVWLIGMLVEQAQGVAQSMVKSPLLDQIATLRIGTYQVGPQIAAHARPASLTDGRLVVDVDHPTWATQLRFLEQDLLARLRDVAGADEISSIELRVRPPR